MFQTSEEVINWIHSRKKFGMKPGLKRMEWMMERLGHPERNFKSVHIGGTNGKGSTTAFLRTILQEAGYEVGSFTSPYFERFEERISVNGFPMTKEELIAAANVLNPLVKELDQTELGGPTVFEIITAIGFYYFANIHRVDIVLVEVGLGGRLDSTNIIDPLLSVITNIGHDHMHILGESLEEIAFEKAGIIKAGKPVVTGVQDPGALQAVRKKAGKSDSILYEYGKDFSAMDLGPQHFQESFSLNTGFTNYSRLLIPLMGKHQIENASLAVMAAEILKKDYSFAIAGDHVVNGLKKTFWPGRFEMISKKPVIVLDGAHNPEGMASFAETVKRHFPDCKGTVLFTALKDKDADRMVGILDELGLDLVFTEFQFPRAAGAKELYGHSKIKNKKTAEKWRDYLKSTVPELKDNEYLFITGSLYFISEVKPFLLKILSGNI